MALRFFHRFPIIGRFVTLNVSKRGASVSVGVPGARVTTGTRGSRVTFGVPGTGLFYTQALTLPMPTTTQAAAWQAEFVACAQQPFDPVVYAAALNRMKDYGLTDADLPPATLAAVEQVRALLRDQFGYRLETRVETPSATVPAARPSLAVPLTLVLMLIAGALVAAWWLSA